MAAHLEAKEIVKQMKICEIYEDCAPATCKCTHKSPLSELTDISEKILREKYGLFPLYQYCKDETENVGFISPLLLLNDSLLRHGGLKDMGAEKVLSLVTKEILVKKDLTYFQVPELTKLCSGKKSSNKEGRLAINEKDAKTFFGYLSLSNLKKYLDEQQTESRDSASQTRRGAKDFDLYDDTVYTSDSGLCIPMKGSQILCFAILAMNSKSLKKKSVTNTLNLSEHEGTIGPNKISNFLLFWIFPFLLNLSQRKVEEMFKFHEANKRNPHDIIKTVQKSALDILKEATQNLNSEIQDGLKKRLKKLYGEEKLSKQYTLLECNGSPIVLVPCQYIFHQGNPVPLCLEDIGRNWKKDDRLMSAEEFLSEFIDDVEVQEDYFKCMRDASLRQGVDYAIIFPDESVFKLLSQALEPDMMMVLKHVKSQGRGMITPSHSVVKCRGGNVVVCFSYLQGTDDSSILGLFRAIGAHYCNHFTVIFLPGATRSKDDSFCKLGNLYIVQGAEEFSFKKGKLQKPQHQISFCQGKAQFTAHGFPSCYDWWSRNVMKDPDFSSAASEYRIVPTFDPSKHLKVGYTSASNRDKLRNICLGKRGKILKSNEKTMNKRGIHAVSLDGTLLSKIYRCGRKDNMGILLGVNNTLGPEDPPPMLKQAVDKIIFYLALAFIKADLREVFPSEPDEKDREEIGGELLSSASPSLSSSSSSEESEEESVEETSGKKRRKRHSHRIKSRHRLRKSRKVIHNFEDDDGNNEEEDEGSDSGFGHYEEMRQESQDKRHSAQKQVADPANDPDQCTSNVDSSYKYGKGQKEEGRQNENGPEAKKRQGAIPKQGPSPCEKGEESIKLIPCVKKGNPEKDELEQLADDIDPRVWKKVARKLKIDDPKITAIDKENEEFSEKKYEMLQKWKQKNGRAASWEKLYQALVDAHLRELAEKHCCEEMN